MLNPLNTITPTIVAYQTSSPIYFTDSGDSFQRISVYIKGGPFEAPAGQRVPIESVNPREFEPKRDRK
jgi:hypothetical protein